MHLSNSLFFIAVEYTIAQICHNFFIYYLVDGHLNCFQFEVTMKDSAMKTYEQVFLGTCFHFS